MATNKITKLSMHDNIVDIAKLDVSDGTIGQFLKTDGNGNLEIRDLEVAYTKSESDARFEPWDNPYDKAEADVFHAALQANITINSNDILILYNTKEDIGNCYLKADADARFEPFDSAYTKAEADVFHVALQADITINSNDILTKENIGVCYTIPESDVFFDERYTKIESDARFEPIDSAYTKSESNSRFALINHNHDTRYKDINAGGRAVYINVGYRGSAAAARNIALNAYGSNSFSQGDILKVAHLYAYTYGTGNHGRRTAYKWANTPWVLSTSGWITI
jgi:hypothetical protein